VNKFYGLQEGTFEKGLRQRGLEFLAVKESEIILKIGAGAGFSLREIARWVGVTGKVHGTDITSEMLKRTEKRLRKAGLQERLVLTKGDARAMPYQDNMFDTMYMTATLELFDTPDIPRVLGEIKRVLKPGGRLVVASLSKEGRESFWFVSLYEWLHRKFPKYASCRLIYVEQAIKNTGFNITRSEECMIVRLVPMRLVLARPR
jgi:demethylmenaquinone methyltransferase/2-methoxy-6-polyprenyl-1,4-benzoquinol methylase